MGKIELQNITYVYGKGAPYEICALDDVSLTFEEGKIIGLIGHTGSGKSTLVQMLNGLIKPDSGKVLLDGQDIWENPKKIRDVRFKVGLVMQYPEYQLFDETVEKDIAFGPRNMGLSDEECEAAVQKAAAFAGVFFVAGTDFLEAGAGLPTGFLRRGAESCLEVPSDFGLPMGLIRHFLS